MSKCRRYLFNNIRSVCSSRVW